MFPGCWRIEGCRGEPRARSGGPLGHKSTGAIGKVQRKCRFSRFSGQVCHRRWRQPAARSVRRGGSGPHEANSLPGWLVFRWGAARARGAQIGCRTLAGGEESDGRNRIGPGNVSSVDSICISAWMDRCPLKRVVSGDFGGTHPLKCVSFGTASASVPGGGFGLAKKVADFCREYLSKIRRSD
jgi:hypothetical protein